MESYFKYITFTDLNSNPTKHELAEHKYENDESRGKKKEEAWIVGVTMQVSCQNQGRGFEATDQCAYVRRSKTGFQISVKILWKFSTF